MSDTDKMLLAPLRLQLKAAERYLTPAILAHAETEFGPYLDLPQHPVLITNQMLEYLCAHCLADRPIEEAQQLLGRSYARYMQIQQSGFLPHILMRLASVASWSLIIKGLPQNYAAATNYGSYWVEEVSSRHWHFNIANDPGLPHFILGTLLQGAESLSWLSQVTYIPMAPQHFSFQIIW